MASLSQVVVGFTERVKEDELQDLRYQALLEQVKGRTTKRYWLENEFFTTREIDCTFPKQAKKRIAKGNATR